MNRPFTIVGVAETRANVVPLRRAVFDEREAIAAENAEAVGWSMLGAAALFGFIAGLLSIAVPAIIIARVEFGAWL